MSTILSQQPPQPQSDQFSIAQLLSKTQATSSYNWVGVLDFLHQQHKQTQLKESEWVLEKSLMQSRVKELEGILQGLEKVVTDLGRRCKMLEVALRQERLKHIKQQNGSQQGSQAPDFVGQLLQENMEGHLNNLSIVPKRKARPYRPLLQKILQEVGLQSIFSPPASPRAENTSNRPSALMQTPNQTMTMNPNSNSGRQSPINRTNMNTTSGFPQQNQTNSFSFLPNQPQSLIQKSRINQTAPTSQQQSFIRVQNYDQQAVEQSEPLIQKCQLTSHFDGVRDALFFQNLPIMVTVSEDCQVKLWDTNQFSDTNNIEPYLSLREHTGPIFTIAGYEVQQARMNLNSPFLAFTAGSEGVIKAWAVPNSEEIIQYGPTENYLQCVASFTAHSDSIWQLRANPIEGLLLSSGADGLIKLWSITDEILMSQDPKSAMIYQNKTQYGQTPDIPTALNWVQYNHSSFVCGYTNTSQMHIFDIETGKVLQTLKYNADPNAQVNSIICHPTQQQLITGHEDQKFRVFDLNSGRMISQIAAHNDAVTSVALNLPGTIIYSVSHDGHIKSWDQRKMQNLNDQKIHSDKYDESIHSIVHHPNQNMLASCGADGLVKIFHTKTL